MNRKLKLLAAFVATSAILVGIAVAASSPSIATSSTSSVTSSSAVLHGSVNPNGASTTYSFQWGLTNTYGLSNPLKSVGSGTKSVSVHITASGLIPGTVYHYRLVALNRFGGVVGSDRTFKTHGNPPPDAATGPASQISASSATVSGVINPHREKTTWLFQYGLTAAYTVQTFGGSVPAGSSPVVVIQQLQGLLPGTMFHYRIVAVHGSSVVQVGADATFMTFPSPRPIPRVRARTTPRRDSSAPYLFTTSGTVIGPSSIPQSLSCFQNATVRFFLGNRQVGVSLAPVAPNCTFSIQTAFHHLPGRGKKHRQVRLRVLIHFRGNGYLAPSDARSETVTLG
jgi:hypothetical protein